jgi:hypothetical protein
MSGSWTQNWARFGWRPLRHFEGGGSLRMKAYMIGCRRAIPLLIHTMAFALQLRKSTENLSQGCDVAGGGVRGGIILQLIMLVSQSFDLGFEPLRGLMTRCLLPWHLLVFWVFGHHPCRDDGSVFFINTDFICSVLPYGYYFLLYIFLLFYFILFLISTYLCVCVCLLTARPISSDTVQRTILYRSVLTAVQTSERSYAWPPPSFSLLCFRC